MYRLSIISRIFCEMDAIHILCHVHGRYNRCLGDGNGPDKDSMQPAAGRADVPTSAERFCSFETICDQ